MTNKKALRAIVRTVKSRQKNSITADQFVQELVVTIEQIRQDAIEGVIAGPGATLPTKPEEVPSLIDKDMSETREGKTGYPKSKSPRRSFFRKPHAHKHPQPLKPDDLEGLKFVGDESSDNFRVLLAKINEIIHFIAP